MTTDRELLYLAAKAAGIQHTYNEFWDGFYVLIKDKFKGEYWDANSRWSPLTDDGDALRLANELELNTFHVRGNAYAMGSESDGSDEQVVSYRDCNDRHAAMRLAIVRAAAELGKTMQ